MLLSNFSCAFGLSYIIPKHIYPQILCSDFKIKILKTIPLGFSLCRIKRTYLKHIVQIFSIIFHWRLYPNVLTIFIGLFFFLSSCMCYLYVLDTILKYNLFSSINVPKIVMSLWLIYRVLEKLILTVVYSVLTALMEWQNSRGPRNSE